ncbi:MAG: winged helix-turn-helix domain-containing protein [Bacillota bacterium]
MNVNKAAVVKRVRKAKKAVKATKVTKGPGTEPLAVSRRAAARALLALQGLLSATGAGASAAGVEAWRGRLKGSAGTREALERLRSVQVDPTSVVERNHHLVMYNRVGGYRSAHLDGLFAKGEAFEYLTNARCILPADAFPHFWPLMRRIAANGLADRERLAESIGEVMARVRDHGAVSPREVGNEGPRLMGLGYNAPDESSKASGRAIDLLWLGGDVVVSRRDGNDRLYDFPERVFGDAVIGGLEPPLRRDEHGLVTFDGAKRGRAADGPSRPWSTPHAGWSPAETSDWLLDLYAEAYGLFDAGDFRFGWQKHTAARRKELLADRVKDGRLVPLAIEGVKRPYWATPRAAELAAQAEGWEVEPEVRFIAPLDSLLWRRERVADLFEFDYSWEIYKKPAQRRFGYYTMPIVYGDRLVGRIDPKLDRANGVLLINILQIEPGARLGKRDRARIDAELDRFAKFHGAKERRINPKGV